MPPFITLSGTALSADIASGLSAPSRLACTASLLGAESCRASQWPPVAPSASQGLPVPPSANAAAIDLSCTLKDLHWVKVFVVD